MRSPPTPALWLVLFLGVHLGTPSTAHSQIPDRKVIQNRVLTMRHEFTLEPGVLPLDVLYKAPTITGRYTWHINDFVAWEALSLTYAPTTDLSLLGLGVGPVRFNHFSPQGNELQENFGYGPFDVDQMRLFAESNVVVKPLYGKFALFNRRNMRVELFGVAGLAAANFVAYNAYPFEPVRLLINRTPPRIPTTPRDVIPQPEQTFILRPGADVGGGMRWLITQRLSLRLDGRGYAFFEGYNIPKLPRARELPVIPVDITPVLYVGAALSLNLGG